jgi:hypothetical protein|tara:strand:+ start:80 stop:529 length:450 start_codon:yes stop_codon:yes gene_type:complete
MQSFRTFFKEASGFATGPVGENPNNLAGSIEINPAALGNPNVVKRLNAVIGAIANMEYLMPEHALDRMKGSLNKIGISFGTYPEMIGESGSFEFPLTLFGGRFGKDGDTPADEFLNDDGISNMVEGGLTLKIQYEMIKNNSCRVFAKVE